MFISTSIPALVQMFCDTYGVLLQQYANAPAWHAPH